MIRHILLLVCVHLTLWNYAITAPSAPLNITTRDVLSKSLIVTWKAPKNLNGGNITQFRISYSFNVDGYSESKTVFKNDTAVREYRLQNLYPYVEYVVLVSEKTDGYGPETKINVKTAEGVPQEAPKSLSVKSMNATTVRVSWEAIPKYLQGGVLKTYRIILQLSAGNVKVKDTHIPADDLSVILNDLSPNTSYRFALEPWTTAGAGNDVSMLEFTTKPEGPSKPLNVTVLEVTDTTVRVAWSKPLKSNHVKSYFVFVLHNGYHAVSKIFSVTNEPLEVIVSKLKQDTVYTIQIGGNNGVLGGLSDEIEFRTHTSPSEGKSNKKKLLIGLLVPLFIIALIVIIAVVIYRRKHSRKDENIQLTSKDKSGNEKTALTDA